MIYLGFDPGNSFGWAAVSSTGQRLGSGTWQLKGDVWEGGGMRWVRLRHQLRQLLLTHGAGDGQLLNEGAQLDLAKLYTMRSSSTPKVIAAYEQVFQKQKSGVAAAVYYGCVSIIKQTCEEMDVPYVGVHTATLKKVATGRGNASKADVMDACVQHWNHDPDDDNEGDALWCAEALRRETREAR